MVEMGLWNFKLAFCLVLFIAVSFDDTLSQSSSRRSRYRRYRYSTTQRPSTDSSAGLAVLYTQLAIWGIGLTINTVLIVILLCFKCKNKRRKTMPVVIPVRPADAQQQQQPVRQQPITNRLSVPRNQDPNIFTVTPVLPSYADVSNNTGVIGPPPAYSVRTPNIKTDYALSVASPPPMYTREEPRIAGSRGTSGHRNAQYSRMSSSVDFVLG